MTTEKPNTTIIWVLLAFLCAVMVLAVVMAWRDGIDRDRCREVGGKVVVTRHHGWYCYHPEGGTP